MQADLIFHRAHIREGTFSHVTAYMFLSIDVLGAFLFPFRVDRCSEGRQTNFKLVIFPIGIS